MLFVSSTPKLPYFSRLPTLFLQGLKDIKSNIHFIDGKSLHSFPSMFLSGDSQEDTNRALSLSFFILIFSPVDSIQALSIISFPYFKCLLLPVHLFIIHLSLFICSGVLKIFRRFVFSPCICSSYFEVLSYSCHLIQPVQPLL